MSRKLRPHNVRHILTKMIRTSTLYGASLHDMKIEVVSENFGSTTVKIGDDLYAIEVRSVKGIPE